MKKSMSRKHADLFGWYYVHMDNQNEIMLNIRNRKEEAYNLMAQLYTGSAQSGKTRTPYGISNS